MKKKKSNNKTNNTETTVGALAIGLMALVITANALRSTDEVPQNEVVVMEDNLQKLSIPSEIALEDTKDYKVIKIQSRGQKRSGNTWIREFTKYYVVKEFYFPYTQELDINDLYALVDIEQNETIIYRNKDGNIVDENDDLEYVELGNLTSYLVKYNYIKEKYKPNELKKIIIENLEQDNKKHDKIDFSYTTKYDILQLENIKTKETSYHIVYRYPNPISVCHKVSSNPEFYATDILYNSIYTDIMQDKYILEIDEEEEVVDKYKDYSYQILGSLSDYLITYNQIQPEYKKEDFEPILERIKKERKPLEKTKLSMPK